VCQKKWKKVIEKKLETVIGNNWEVAEGPSLTKFEKPLTNDEFINNKPRYNLSRQHHQEHKLKKTTTKRCNPHDPRLKDPPDCRIQARVL
jgi:hypothetical protein